MKLRVEPASRLPHVPVWALCIVGLWLALLAGHLALDRALDRQTTLCQFKRLTGHPCPTCGATRGVEALAGGRLMKAATMNPMLTVAGGVAVGLLTIRLIWRRRLRVTLSKSERRAVWAIAIALFLANWGYLIAVGR